MKNQSWKDSISKPIDNFIQLLTSSGLQFMENYNYTQKLVTGLGFFNLIKQNSTSGPVFQHWVRFWSLLIAFKCSDNYTVWKMNFLLIMPVLVWLFSFLFSYLICCSVFRIKESKNESRAMWTKVLSIFLTFLSG